MDCDLNLIPLGNDGTYDDGDHLNREFVDNSTSSSSGTTVYFRNIEQNLIKHIKESDAVFGAVAWLTHFKILDALATLKNVSIILQKEDFLRPDESNLIHDKYKSWKKNLRKKYSALECDLVKPQFNNILSALHTKGSPNMEAVRCVGNNNSDNKIAFPRMHNKFLIFSKVSDKIERVAGTEIEFDSKSIEPYAVWTGSYNLSQNASKSLENGLFITDMEIVNAYFQEYGQIAAISEPLDWKHDWINPEWKVGM